MVGLDSMRDAVLVEGASGDERALARMRKRVGLGEPIPYVLGKFKFRSIELKIDRRAYITDAELTHLVDFVIDRVFVLRRLLNRPVRVVEFGVGCGALSLALLSEMPSDWVNVIGVDLDSAALQLADENARALGLPLELVESDLLKDLPVGWQGDIVFGDPPWGNYETCYDDNRDSHYYRAMPPLAVYPGENPLGVHMELLESWMQTQLTEVALNCGVLPLQLLEPLKNGPYQSRLIKTKEDITIFHATK